jgi:putative ABC transport system substrate-binding protein
MVRACVGILASLAAILWCAPGRAEPVIVARSSELAPYVALEKAFSAALTQQTRSVSLASPDGRAQLKAALGSGAGLLLAIGPDAARAAAELRPSCPVILALVPEARKSGLEVSTPLVPMFVPPGRQLKALRAALPGAKKIGILYDPAISKPLVNECEAAARSAGVTLVRKEVGARQEVAAAVRAMVGEVDAIWLLPDTTVIGADTFKFIMLTALQAKVPVVGFSEGMSKAGALLAVEADYGEMGQKAARAAQRILAGQAAAPEAPDGAIYLNAKSAGVLGLSLPAEIKAQAVKVFE